MALRFDSHPFEFDLDPVLFAFKVISQERGQFIHVEDEDVHVTVVVEIPESAPSAAVRCAHTGPGFPPQFLKGTIAQIAKTARGVLFAYCENLRSTSG